MYYIHKFRPDVCLCNKEIYYTNNMQCIILVNINYKDSFNMQWPLKALCQGCQEPTISDPGPRTEQIQSQHRCIIIIRRIMIIIIIIVIVFNQKLPSFISNCLVYK